MKIKLQQICAPPDLQSRIGLDEDVVSEYAEAMRAGAAFPAVVLFQDPDDPDIFWLGGGFHRRAAAEKAGLEAIEADIRVGGKRDALLFSVGENASHGLRRANSDKRKAVETLLLDSEWAQWSDREIAKQVHVSPTFVGVVRADMASGVHVDTCNASGVQKRKGADGKAYSVQVRRSGPVKDPHSDFHTLFEDFIAQVPEEKRHYVCGQLRTLAWKHDPEAQAEQASVIAQGSLERRKK